MIALTTFLHTLGWGGLFLARAFGPLLAVACVCRYADQLPAGWSLPFGAPAAWFVADEFLLATGALAALELLAQHVRGSREFLRRVDVLYKPAACAIGAVGVGLAADHGLPAGIKALSAPLARVPREVALLLEPGLIVAVALLVALALAYLRRTALARLAEHSPEDELGIGRIVSWSEDLWTAAGPLLLLLSGYAPLAATLPAALMLARLRAAFRIGPHEDQVICVCGQPNHLAAPRCARCKGRNASPVAVGMFGQPTSRFASDLERHALALYETKRCPRCAARLEASNVGQFCTACGHAAASDLGFIEDYDRGVRARTAGTLIVSGLLGALPLVGLVPAIFHAHRRLIAPYRRHARRLRSTFKQLVLRLAWVVAAVVQLVPGAGLLVLPLMGFAAHRAYRAEFRRQAITGGAGFADDDGW